MLAGPHIDPPLAAIPALLNEHRLTCFQTTLRNPIRLGKDGVPDKADQEAWQARTSTPALWGIVHASLITNLASTDPRIRNASAGALVADANLAARLGMQGVCFHVGYAKGHASREAALEAVCYKLREVVSRLDRGARVLLENGAERGELGETVAELAAVINGIQASSASVGIVLDTCHLHVSGFDMAAADSADRLAGQLEDAGLLGFVTAFHLNDALAECGSYRDRHAIPGQGTIGAGLKRLVANRAFAEMPCILELKLDGALAGISWLRST
ncbi:MAG: deoxyribonuclease IV [Armatimonadetes bacterium]|nr:deoxyribonuclease IV [Armatimonadota bacterium]MDE2205377.1 deoxyribonuclease IV [Armatimonadota bacterium]